MPVAPTIAHVKDFILSLLKTASGLAPPDDIVMPVFGFDTLVKGVLQP